MSLLDAFNEVKEQENKVSENSQGYRDLPDGTYTVTLDAAQYGTRADNSAYLRFTFRACDGDYEGVTHSIFPTLAEVTKTGKPMPNFVLARSIREIVYLGEAVGITVPDKVFSVKETENARYEQIEQLFAPAIDKKLRLRIKTKPNLNNPAYPIKNYTFSKAPDAPATPQAQLAHTNQEAQTSKPDMSLKQAAEAKEAQASQPSDTMMYNGAPVDPLTPADMAPEPAQLPEDSGDKVSQDDVDGLPF